MKSFTCTICGGSVGYDGPLPSLYPFCSPRCQRVDLGNWLLGKYAIERDVTDEDVPESSQAGGQTQIDAKRGAE